MKYRGTMIALSKQFSQNAALFSIIRTLKLHRMFKNVDDCVWSIQIQCERQPTNAKTACNNEHQSVVSEKY